MSRHVLVSEPVALVVGWDHPLQTFFAQELGRGLESPATFWVGLRPRELYELEDLRRALPIAFRGHWTAKLERELYADRDEGR